jgi:hypothetical protein
MPRPPLFRTWVRIMAVPISLRPGGSWMLRKSYPVSTKRVTEECYKMEHPLPARLVDAYGSLDPMSDKRTKLQARSARSAGRGVRLRRDESHIPKIAFVISTHRARRVRSPSMV